MVEINESRSHYVLFECAHAAVSWHETLNKSSSASVILAMTKISFAMSLVKDLQIQVEPFESAADFIDLISKPINQWLPIDTDSVLWDVFGITGYAEDIVSENYSAGEVEQKVVKTAKDYLSRKTNGQTLYVKFRSTLIESPILSFQNAQKAIMPTGLALQDVYEPLPANTILSKENLCFPCPNCGWPMKLDKETVQCSNQQCIELGAKFRLENHELRPLGSLCPPKALSNNNLWRVKRGIWRYTLLPGLTELRLKAELEKLQSIKVELWPFMDRYDLQITYGDKKNPLSYQQWHVDVKDWSSPVGLAKRLKDEMHDEHIIFVVPDDKSNQVKYLKEYFGNSSKYQFHTCSSFTKVVKSHIANQNVSF